MARTAIATLQTVWDCRWSQPGRRSNAVPDAQQPEGMWVCVREGGRRAVDENECATCTHWELATADDLALAAVALPIATATVQPMVMAAPATRIDRTLHLLTWACVVLTALTFGVVGLTVLTSPLAIPFTVTLWLTGAALIGFAVTGHLPGGR